MLFLWGLLGAVLAAVALLLVPLRLSSMLHWPGFSEAEVRLGPWLVSRWQASGPSWPRRSQAAGSRGGDAKGAVSPPLVGVTEAVGAFFAALQRAPVGGLELEAEGGLGDPAATALLYGAAWAALGGLMAAAGHPVRVRLTPRLEGPGGGKLHARGEVAVTLGRLALAALRALAVMRRGS